MTNPSLKEQLEALSLTRNKPAGSERSEKSRSKFMHKNKHPRTEQKSASPAKAQPAKAQKPKPAWLEQAQYGVELLKAYFPDCFKENKEIKPLKVGIKQDLVKELSTFENVVISDKSCMINSLSYYVNSPNYHKSVVEGATRIDLKGNVAGLVTADEAKYSLEKQQNKSSKKPHTRTQSSTHSNEKSHAQSNQDSTNAQSNQDSNSQSNQESRMQSNQDSVSNTQSTQLNQDSESNTQSNTQSTIEPKTECSMQSDIQSRIQSNNSTEKA